MDEQPLSWNDLTKGEQGYLRYVYTRNIVHHRKGSKLAASLVEKGLLSSVGLVSGRYICRVITPYGKWLCESETYAT